MGRPHDGIRQGYDLLVKGVGNDSVRDIVALTGQEVVDVLDRAAPAETITATHDLKLPLNGKNELAVYAMCTGANIAATDTLTFKFYIREEINGEDKFPEVYQAANYTVTTAGVTAGQVKKFAVTDTDNIIKNATHYSVATDSGILMPANCYGVLLVGKSFDVDNAISITGDITIDSTTPVNVLETNSADILTELEKLDTGEQKTQIVDGDGNVISSTANRLNVDTVTEDNQEETLTAVETWLPLDENIKAASFILDCSSNTEASLEFTHDRSASPSGVITSDLGTLINDKESGYLAGAVAQVRMANVVDNEVEEVKSTLSTNLVGDNNDLDYTAKLDGTDGDAITVAYTDPGVAVDEVKSTLNTSLVGANNDIAYTSKLDGTDGDAITVAYIDPSAPDESLGVVVTGTNIVVNLATDGGGVITTIANDIITAIEAEAEAHALVGVAAHNGDGTGIVTALVQTALTGGVDEVLKPLTIGVTGTDIVVTLENDTSGITTLASEIITAIEGDTDANALVSVANKAANNGTGIVTAMAQTNLSGGVDFVAATLPKLWVIGVK